MNILHLAHGEFQNCAGDSVDSGISTFFWYCYTEQHNGIIAQIPTWIRTYYVFFIVPFGNFAVGIYFRQLSIRKLSRNRVAVRNLQIPNVACGMFTDF